MEARAYAELGGKVYLGGLMDGQHAKGREEYKHSIDHWDADREERVREGACEHVDFITYMVALGAPRWVFWCLRPVSWWLERQLWKEFDR